MEELDEQFIDSHGAQNFSRGNRQPQQLTPDERNQTGFARRKAPTSFKSPESQNFFNKKLVSLKETSKQQNNFVGDDPMKIKAGMIVEHQRFGQGKVLNIEGAFPNIKATVFFQSGTQKQLLLKYAKLKIKR